MLHMTRAERAKAVEIATGLRNLNPGPTGELEMLLTRMNPRIIGR
jgi:hypothetical protein